MREEIENWSVGAQDQQQDAIEDPEGQRPTPGERSVGQVHGRQQMRQLVPLECCLGANKESRDVDELV